MKWPALSVAPRERSLAGTRLALMVGTVGLALSAALFGWLWREADRAAEENLEAQLISVVDSAEASFELVADQLVSLSGLFRASEEVTPEEFDVFTDDIGLVPGMSGIGYLVRVEGSRLGEYEQELSRLHGRTIHVSQLDAAGRPMAVTPRADHYPLQFVSPEGAWRERIGYDLASDANVASTIEEAVQTDDVAVSPFFRLSQDSTGDDLVMVKAVPAPHTRDSEVLVGALLDFRALLQSSLPAGMAPHVTLEFTEGGLGAEGDDGGAARELAYGGREWTIAASAVSGSPFASERTGAYTVLAIGALASVLASLLVFTVKQRVEAATALAAARQTTEAKNRFIASISHELRTPLTAVLGYTQILQGAEELSTGEQMAMMRIITAEATDLAYMIDDLLVAARSESDLLAVARERVDLRPEVERVVEASRVRDRIHLSPTGDGWPPVLGDRARIRQILRNLIDNASRHGGDRIVIALRMEDGQGVVDVSDDGPGLPGDLRERAFQLYHRFGESRDVTESLGLGLSVSSHLASLMEGQLRYERRDGWTVFTLSLPLDPTAVSEPRGTVGTRV